MRRPPGRGAVDVVESNPGVDRRIDGVMRFEKFKAEWAKVPEGTAPEKFDKARLAASMGDKDGEHRHNLLKPYQVNKRLMAKADPQGKTYSTALLRMEIEV